MFIEDNKKYICYKFLNIKVLEINTGHKLLKEEANFKTYVFQKELKSGRKSKTTPTHSFYMTASRLNNRIQSIQLQKS